MRRATRLILRRRWWLLISLLEFWPVAAQGQEVPVSPPRFEIVRFDVTGNTLLPADVVERIVAPFTGKDRDFGDIQRALETLEKAYVGRGYGVVEVVLPEQAITAGVVRLRVIEPRIAKIAIEGNRHFDAENVRQSLPTLREGATPNSLQIAKNLHVLNENPAKRTTVLMRSGGSENEVNAEVRVEDERPWNATLMLDNTGNRQTGHYRVGLGYQHANIFNRDHVLTARYITSPGHVSDVKIFGVGYRIPFYSLGSSMEFVAGYSDVDFGTVQNLFTVTGSGTILALRYNQHLSRIGDYEHKIVYELDYRAYRRLLTPAAQPLVPGVTVHPIGASYSGLWRTIAGELSFRVHAAQNLFPVGNDDAESDFKAARADAKAGYRLYRYDLSYVAFLPGDWQARAVLNGQESHDALVPGEQFGVGGADSVRGFLEREVANDRGYRGSVEVYTPEFGSRFGKEVHGRALVFYDWATVSRNSMQPGEASGESIASTGFGLRFSHGKRFSMRLDYGHILNGGGARSRNDRRVSASFAFVLF